MWRNKRRKNVPFLKLRGRNETRSAVFGVFQFALPPIVIVLADDLDDVTHAEPDASLLAGNEVVLGGVIFKLCSHIDLRDRSA